MIPDEPLDGQEKLDLIFDKKGGKPKKKRKKKNDESKLNKPKRPISGFFLYKRERYNEIAKENPLLDISGITRRLSHEWNKVLGKLTKERYKLKYEESLEQYYKDMEEYNRLKKIEDEKSNVKPPPPKRPISGFFMFKEDRLKNALEEYPSLKISEICKLISKEWTNNTPAETKKEYKRKYEENKVGYDRRMKEYIKKYGKPFRKHKKHKKHVIKNKKKSLNQKVKDKIKENEGFKLNSREIVAHSVSSEMVPKLIPRQIKVKKLGSNRDTSLFYGLFDNVDLNKLSDLDILLALKSIEQPMFPLQNFTQFYLNKAKKSLQNHNG